MNIQTPPRCERSPRIALRPILSSESLDECRAPGAEAQVSGFSHRRCRRAPLRERILCRGLQIYREPGDQTGRRSNEGARRPLRTSEQPGRLSGHRRPHHPSLVAQIREDTGRAPIATSSRRSAGWMRWASITAVSSRRRCCFSAPIRRSKPRRPWPAPTIAGSASASWPTSRPSISMLYLPFNDPEAAYQDREGFRRPARASSASW